MRIGFEMNLRNVKFTINVLLLIAEMFAEVRKYYLLIYNTIQLLICGYILTTIATKLYTSGTSNEFYGDVSTAMKVLHALQVVEIVNSLIGITNNNVRIPLLQLCNRVWFVYVMIDGSGEFDLQNSLIVIILYVSYATADMIRYIYYIFNSNYIVKMLRYNMWIALYPIGAISELFVLLKAYKYFTISKKMSIELPNMLNFSFDITIMILIYMCCLIPGVTILMQHMYRQRMKRISGKSNVDKSN